MVERISRSEQKRLLKQVEQLAAELAELSDKDLRKFPGSDEIVEEILQCRNLKGGARKRQIKFLAKVLRNHALDEIYRFLGEKKGSALKQNQLLHKAERWRDIIVNEAIEICDMCRRDQLPFEPDYQSVLLAEAQRDMPDLDTADLRRCAYQYAKTRNKSHYRELFRMIKAATELQERKPQHL